MFLWWLISRRRRVVVHHHHCSAAPQPIQVVVKRSWWEAAGQWWGRQSVRTRWIVVGVVLALVVLGAVTGPAQPTLDTGTTP